ncbi:MAG: DUF5011 domain-containing protein [Clostridiales bacterium]|nr:DUF5011 domain-containing protein [Clostridiales bacterium]
MENNKNNNPINNEPNKTKQYKVVSNKKKRKIGKIIKRVFLTLLLLTIIGAGVGFALIYGIAKDAKLDAQDLAIEYENSVVLDIEGNVIANLSGDENREIVTVSEMSKYLPKAFVAIEDERFYEHDGVDIKRTAAATGKYVLSKIGIGSADYGGSTITQQLVKNLTQEKDRTWKRKVKEMARAYYIEQDLSKDQVLELYLNLIFLGGNTYGVEVASNYYFSKSASDLTLAESAFLAGINNSPNSYSPFSTEEDDIKKVKNRTETVLDKMYELKELTGITEEEYKSAVEEVKQGIKFQKGVITENVYSYHTDAAITQVIKDLQEKNDWTEEYARLYVKSGGLTIYSTENPAIQTAMEEEVAKDKYQISSRKTKDENGNYVSSQAAMVLIDHTNGYVLGCVGGTGTKTDSFGLNRATQSPRQTGSSIKPLFVAAGVQNGTVTAGTVFDDIPTTFGSSYSPKNWNHYRGLIPVRYAIETSQNIPMVKLLQTITPEYGIEFLHKLGITSVTQEKDANLSAALGGLSHGVSTLEMAGAFATIANDGKYIEPTFYTKVVDANGDIVIEVEQREEEVMSPAAAYVVKEILTQPVKTGTASFCGISGISVAAKTGTTDDDFDRWLCGFTPYYSAACWFGYDENEEVRYSGNPAGSIWDAVMTSAHNGKESKYFANTRPNGVTSVSICKCSGKLATEHCANDPRGTQVYGEYFVAGTVPSQKCDSHVKARICNETGLLATEFCQDVTEKVYITRPNSDTSTSWQRAKDAEFMLTIKDTCNVHTQELDKVAPAITLKGAATITLEVGGKYTEQGATATDNKDGDLTSKIQISGTVDVTKAGTYKIDYTVQDAAGNSTTVSRTVVVKEKAVTKPAISLRGGEVVILELNQEYSEPGYSATDSNDGDLTDKVEVTGADKIDASKPGAEYTITYTVKNSKGETTMVSRRVKIKASEVNET